MPPDVGDAANLWDMHDACVKIARYIKDHTEQAFLQNDLLQSAVERQTEIIGEAARNVSDEFRRRTPKFLAPDHRAAPHPCS